jgi:hypothetical protein
MMNISKPFTIFGTIVLLALTSVESWSLPFLPISSGGNGKELFTASVIVGAALFIAPLSAPALDIAGSYNDPNHPNCQRLIEVKEGNTYEFSLTGTDGNPACSPDGVGDKKFQLFGKVDNDSNVYVDFSPKGGPKDLKGLFNADKRAIQWPDGNVWTMKN